MGSGITREKITDLPDLEYFKLLTHEYEKLKGAGVSVEEMHLILGKRASKLKPGSGTGTVATPAGPGESTAPLQPAKIVPVAGPPKGMAMIIDDSAVAIKVASKVLQNFNYDVLSAQSAKLGYELLEQRYEDIQIILLDVVMPKVDGVECLGWIKENADMAHIPIYMLSGLEDQTLSDVCIERGAEGMLIKPLNAEVLIGILKKHGLEVEDPMDTQAMTPQHAASAAGPRFAFGDPSSPRGGQNSKAAADSASSMTSTSAIASHAATATAAAAAGMSKAVQNSTVVVGQQAPSFKLCDTRWKDFVFPSVSQKKNILFAFFPSVYCVPLYNEGAFMHQLFEAEEKLRENGVTIVCISNDLPHALAAGKDRFRLPYTMLADPTLVCARRYVGTFNAGHLMLKTPAANSQSLHPLNAFVAPNLGLVLVNKQRSVVAKWIGISETGMIDPHFPDVIEWVYRMQEIVQLELESEHISEIVAAKDTSNIVKAPMLTLPTRSEGKSKAKASDASGEHKGGTSAATGGGKSAGKKYVLIVDDSSVSSRVASKKLDDLGYLVISSYNGLIALDMLKKDPQKFGVVLTDVVMPVCDGFEFLAMVKGVPELSHLMVIMLTGLQGEDITKKCLDAGAAGLMKKPFDVHAFQNILKEKNYVF